MTIALAGQLRPIWQWLTTIPNITANDIHRLRLRVFMSVLVVILLTTTLTTAVLLASSTNEFAKGFMLVSTLVAFIPYLLLRRGHVRIGITLLQALTYALCIIWIMLNREFSFYVVALITPILMFSEFHSMRTSIAFSAFCVLTGALGVLSFPPQVDQITAIMLLIILATLAIMNNFTRSYVENKLLEKNRQLTASEAKFRHIVEQSYDGIRLIDENGTIIEWNKGEEMITGVSRDAAIGKPIWEVQARLSLEDLPHEALATRFHQVLTKYVEDMKSNQVELVEYDTPLRRQDGILRYVSHAIFPVRTDNGLLICNITRDLTERHRNERRLRQLSKAVEQSPTSIVITDRSGAIEYVNPKFTRVTGYTLEESLGQNPRILKTEHTPSEDYTELWQKILDGDAWRGEFLNKKKNGEYYWELASISPITNDAGEITHFVAVKEDITEQKAMQEALRQSEERFRQMFENNPAMHLLIDPDTGDIVDANPSAIAFYGYDRETLLQMQIQDIDVNTEAVIRQDIRRALDQDRKMFNFQHRLASGDIRDVEVFSTPIEIQENTYLYSIIIDITQRVKAEQKLRVSEERFRQIAENVKEVFYVRDPINDKVLYISPVYEHIWGHAVEEVYANSRRFIEQIHPLDQPGFLAALQAETEEGIMIDHEYRVIRPDGQVFWIWARNFPIYNDAGELYRIVGIAEDITGTKQAQQALHDSEARYRALFERTNDAVFIFDLEFTIIEANQQAANMLGYTLDEIIGKKSWAFLADSEIAKAKDRARAVMHGEEFPLYERNFLCKDGRLINTEVNIALVYDDDGYPKHVHSIVRDITIRKRAADREIALQVELQRRDILQRFIRDASHEFKTPLSTIETSLYLAEHTPDAEKRALHHEKLRQQIQRIVALVDSLAKLVELDNLDSLKTTVPVDLKSIIADLVRRIREYAPQTFDVAIADTLSTVQGNHDDLALAIRHLLENAVRHTPNDGRIMLQVRHGSPDNVCIKISNTTRIDDDDLPHIFDRFYRADDAHSTPGFGLGLPITRRILALHGGEINVTSDDLTTFSVTLPVQPVVVAK